MKKTLNKLSLWAILLGFVLSANPLSAQDIRNDDKNNQDDIVQTNADSLQHIIDSLQNALQEMERRLDDQGQKLTRARAEADSLQNVCYCDMSYVLNYGNALLYRQYTARTQDIAILLATAPDSLKKKDWEQTMSLARKMIQASNVSQDIRNRVFHLLESVPQSEMFAEDIREVLSHVPADMQVEYSLTEQAISLIDAIPKSVTADNDRYATVMELLKAYPDANEELKAVLLDIQNHPDNNINITDRRQTFIKQIKSMKYYKNYYGKSWSIPYLNSVIDQALARLENATSHVDFQDLIKSL